VFDDGAYARRSMIYKREGVKASKGPPPESSGESDSDGSYTDEPVMMRKHVLPHKQVKKREFAYRFVLFLLV